MADLLYNLDDIINEAIINNRPVVIVEGIDDVKIYDNVAKNCSKNVLTTPIELIEGYAEGCNGVIRANTQILINDQENEIPIDLVLLVIDKDVRDFRNELPANNKFSLVLKNYSFESHFVTPNNFKYVLEKTTNATQLLLDSIDLEAEFQIFFQT